MKWRVHHYLILFTIAPSACMDLLGLAHGIPTKQPRPVNGRQLILSKAEQDWKISRQHYILSQLSCYAPSEQTRAIMRQNEQEKNVGVAMLDVVKLMMQGKPLSAAACNVLQQQSKLQDPPIDGLRNTILHIFAYTLPSIPSSLAIGYFKDLLKHYPWELHSANKDGWYAMDVVQQSLWRDPHQMVLIARVFNQALAWHVVKKSMQDVAGVEDDAVRKAITFLQPNARNAHGDNALHLLLKDCHWRRLTKTQLKKRIGIIREYVSVDVPDSQGCKPIDILDAARSCDLGPRETELDSILRAYLVGAQRAQEEKAKNGTEGSIVYAALMGYAQFLFNKVGGY